MKDVAARRGLDINNLSPMVFMVEEGADELTETIKSGIQAEDIPTLQEYLMDNFTKEERQNIITPKYFYNVIFEKPGGLVMPIIVQYNYVDGTSKTETYPAEIWRLNDRQVSKAIPSQKEISSIVVDPN